MRSGTELSQFQRIFLPTFIFLNLFDSLRVFSHVTDFNARNRILIAKPP